MVRARIVAAAVVATALLMTAGCQTRMTDRVVTHGGVDYLLRSYNDPVIERTMYEVYLVDGNDKAIEKRASRPGPIYARITREGRLKRSDAPEDVKHGDGDF